MELKVVFFVVIFTLFNPVLCSYVTLTSHGYEGIVVTFDENSPELTVSNCSLIVNWTRSFLQESSTALWQATNQRAYFGNVTIILPKSWAADGTCKRLINSIASPWIRKNKETVKLTTDHPIFGNRTYSFQFGGCGHPGLPVHLPISSMANLNINSAAKTFVHQWAHHRYGVFDEEGVPGDPKHPSGYLQWNTDGGRDLVPNGCVSRSSIEGSWQNCSSKWDNYCEFSPRLNSYTTTSLMYKPEIEKVDHFCTEENHKKTSPNKQNYFCNGKSTSQVVFQHSDFTSQGMQTFNSTIPINFTIVEEPFTGYHFILDIYSFDNNELDDITNSIAHFIYLLPDGLSVSLDVFNDVTSPWTPLTVLNETNKISIADNLRLISQKSTNVNGFGAALAKGIESAQRGQDVIVMAKAASISSIDVQTYIDQYIDEKVNCHFVYFGFPTSLKSTKLSHFGSFYVIPSQFQNNLESTYSWAINTLQTIYSNTHVYRTKIFEKVTIETNGEIGTFSVDAPISKLFFTVYPLTNQTFNLNSSSSYIRFRTGNTDYKFGLDPVSNFEVANATLGNPLNGKGIWNYEIHLTANRKSRLRLEIWIESSDPSFIKTRSWTNSINNDLLNPWENPVAVYTEILQNRKPVNGVTVYADVYSGDANGQGVFMTRIPLKDEGALDVTQGDGIYTGLIGTFSNYSQLYSVKIEIHGMNSSAKVDDRPYKYHPTSGSRIVMTNPVTAADQFNRFIYGPSFQTSGLSMDGLDKIPPTRITDLSIEEYRNGAILLNWTAPRDNYGTGDLVLNFDVLQTYDGVETTVHSGNLTNDGKDQVNITIRLPSSGKDSDIFYEVQAKDTAGNKGMRSNMVVVHIPPPSGGLSAASVTGIVVGVVLGIIAIAIVVICCFCPKTKEKITNRANKIRTNTRTKFTKNYKKNNKKEKTTPKPFTAVDVKTSDDEQKRESKQQRSVDLDKSSDSETEVKTTYFGEEDVGNSKGYNAAEERDIDEIVKRAPSMDFQLATIIKERGSDLSINRVGVEKEGRIVENRRIYAKTGNIGRNWNNVPNNRLSQSETNLYSGRIPPDNGLQRNPSPYNSYLNVQAQRVKVLPDSSMANTLRAGMASNDRNDGWQDTNSFIYTDSLSGGSQPSTFGRPLPNPNQVGLPSPSSVASGGYGYGSNSNKGDYSNTTRVGRQGLQSNV